MLWANHLRFLEARPLHVKRKGRAAGLVLEQCGSRRENPQGQANPLSVYSGRRFPRAGLPIEDGVEGFREEREHWMPRVPLPMKPVGGEQPVLAPLIRGSSA